MTALDRLPLTVASFDTGDSFDEAELAAAAFLAGNNGRTLDAYRHDLCAYIQWAADVGLGVLDATRPHIELYRRHSNNDNGLRVSEACATNVEDLAFERGHRTLRTKQSVSQRSSAYAASRRANEPMSVR